MSETSLVEPALTHPARHRPALLNNGESRRRFRLRLLGWYKANARDLPWRRTDHPYAIWVSEIMLQQTRVAAVIERYAAFLERFPTVAALAAADEADVLALWSGLGYYRRARMMLRAAKVLVDEHKAALPSTAAGLRRLPGIGSYTSAAIASIAFGEAVAVVDGNVERVVMRLAGWSESARRPEPGLRIPLAVRIQTEAASLLDPGRPGDFNQVMMELGATICLPRGPLCLQCPVFDFCATRGEHPTLPRRRMTTEQIACALVRRDGEAGHEQAVEVLLEQRPASETVMSGMWELPALTMAIATPERTVLRVRHAIMQTNYSVAVAALTEDEIALLPPMPGGAARKWFRPPEVAALPLTGLTRKVLTAVKLFPGNLVPKKSMASPNGRVG